jgi:hypothetical protein
VPSDDDNQASSRIAVIAVHGVAEQAAGATARKVADLLVASAPAGAAYRGVDVQALTLAVPPLRPAGRPGQPARGDATPCAAERSTRKAFQQSLRSDFHRARWRAPTTTRAARRPACRTRADDDRGIAVTDYLLAKSLENGARTQPWETTRIGLELAHGAGRARVDVFEMYWADLSRLSGSMPRIVSELFTLMFRLSKLGRETVNEASETARRRQGDDVPGRVRGAAWLVVTNVQAWLDWLFVNVLGILFFYLGVLSALLVVLGFAAHVVPAVLHACVAAALLAGAGLRLFWLRRDGTPSQLVRPLLVIAWTLGAQLAPRLWTGVVPAFAEASVTGGALLWLAGASTLALLRVGDERFPFVRTAGTAIGLVLALALLASLGAEYAAARHGIDWREAWSHATMFTVEVDLLAVKWWWILAAPLLLVWLVAGLVAATERGYAARAAIATGRLGVVVSFGAFLIVTMSAWGLAENAIEPSVSDIGYMPCLFDVPANATGAGFEPNACVVLRTQGSVAWPGWNQAQALRTLRPGEHWPSAADALHDRYVRSVTEFSLIAALLVLLLAYIAVMFVPSIAAELRLIVERVRVAAQRTVASSKPPAESARLEATRELHARRLGRWLTCGFRRFDLFVLLVTCVGAALGLLVALAFLDSELHLLALADPHQVEGRLSALSQTLLRPLVFTTASAGAALTLFGGVLSRYVPALRTPLDVALDVDDHFREFPRSDIARARIFSRYAALLEHVAARGYERLVIVAHSQGSVISAELLRFLASDGRRAPAPGATPRLAGGPLPPVHLLTLGCPLRQLYAARFPGVYDWILRTDAGRTGPRADDIGAVRWFNGYCSGDYVGRWLWSDAGGLSWVHPMTATLVRPAFGRVDVYGGFHPAPPVDATFAAAREAEVCLGLGAHTHYLEDDQATVAWMIDHLVRQ